MISKKATKLISESRIQARRDLDSARVLLTSPDPHLENVAYLLEQSFEKIINASYAKYMLETNSAMLHEVYKKMSNHDIDFILDILDETYTTCVKTLARFLKTWLDNDEIRDMFPKKLKKFMRSPERLGRSIGKIQNIKNEVKAARNDFVKFMSKLDSTSLTYLDIDMDEIDPQFSTTMKNVTTYAADVVSDPRAIHDHITFFIHLDIAQYALLHAFHSRYPLIGCRMSNLEAYRDNPKLKEFFDALANHIEIMLDSETGFTELLVLTHSINSNIHDKI